MASFKVRWGICSAGRICRDFSTGLRLQSGAEHDITAVAARSLEKAEAFAKDLSIPVAYGSYEELAACPDIDIVYIGAIHIAHVDLCKLFLNAGKNVLCEKPIAINRKQAEELFQLAKEKNLFLMEAVWSRCFPVYKCIRQALKDGSIGEPQVVTANFGFHHNDVPRLVRKELGGGALLDIGLYNVSFTNMVFREKPVKIVADGFLNEEGVDILAGITLLYSNNRMARLQISFTCDLDNKAVIYGSKGSIVVPRFWCPDQMEMNGERILEPLPEAASLEFPGGSGMVYEQRCVRECLMKGLKECPNITHQDTLDTLEIMDEARRQLGVTYPADSQ